MGSRRGRLWWPVVALLAAVVASLATLASAQANAANSLKKTQDVRPTSNLSPVEHKVDNKLQGNVNVPLSTNIGHHEPSVRHRHKRTAISKREAKKPKNTKRRVKFNKKEIERQLQQQEKEEKESGVKATSKEESTVDTAEVLSSSNDLITESGKDSSSTYESYSESSDSEDKNDIDDDDEDGDDSDDDDDDDDEEDDDSNDDTSDDKTESTEEVSLTSEEKSKKSKDISLSTIPHSGPDSSPPASSDSTDESSGSKAISGSSSDYSEISYTMSSSAEDAFPVGDSSLDETKEKEDVSASKDKSKSDSAKLANKAKIKTAEKKGKKKRLKLNKKGSKNKVKGNRISLKEKQSKQNLNLQKGVGPQKLATSNTKSEKKDQQQDREVHLQVTTEKVLRMVQSTAEKNKVVGSIAEKNPSSSNRRASAKMRPAASKEKPTMELMKVKPADPNRKNDLEQELIKDYPENGTVEITNWAGTFAPIVGEPYVAPLHHQPDEFWDAIYTSKDPDLPTPSGAGVSGETTVRPLQAPEMNMRKFATTMNLHPVHHTDPSHSVQSNPHSEDPIEVQHDSIVAMNGANHGISQKGSGLIHPQISEVLPLKSPDSLDMAKEKSKGNEKKNNKKKAKLTLKEKRKKKKEKKANLGGLPKISNIAVSAGANHEHLQNHHPDLVDEHPALHDDDTIHPHISEISPHFPGKAGAHADDISLNLQGGDKSEDDLKTPSEEERESGTTYKPEGAYEYPSFRHPEFNVDTAYDEHGIPIHESPGWKPPPTLPGDNRFGKGRNQAAAGMNNKVKGPLAAPHVAPVQKVEPKRLAVSVTEPKHNLHPEHKMINNYHGFQDHLAMLEHQKAVEVHQGLNLDPLHPLESKEHSHLPLLHKEGLGLDNVNHRIRKRKAAVSGSQESLESISDASSYKDEFKVSPPVQDHAAAKETAYGGTRPTRLTKQAWLKNISRAHLRPTGTTRPTRKEAYTGFVFTERPRWNQYRGHPRFEAHPLVPPQQHTSHETHSTKSPPHLLRPTTLRPESTTEWWPPGVSLGPRPVSRIPVQVIYPEIGRWEFDWSKVKVRTSATRWTYAPEVVNYPVTFDWNFPRHLRKDKWTQRPDWPLESPLWSSEALDYLEERTLPRILESGETEYPPTSPLPWWTYPPWWLEKKEAENITGTTIRPYTRKSTDKTVTTKEAVNEHQVEEPIPSKVTDSKAFEGMLKEYDGEVSQFPKVQGLDEDFLATKQKSTEGDTSLGKMSRGVKSFDEIHETTRIAPTTEAPPRNDKKDKFQRKTHHKGPWWHLTVVEHFTEKSSENRKNKRVKRSPKLVRQNAIRRKWIKFREGKNPSHTLDLNNTKSVPGMNSSPSIQRVLSNFTFKWPVISNRSNPKDFVENFIKKALDELKQRLIGEKSFDFHEKNIPLNKTHLKVKNHLSDLHDLFLTALNNRYYKEHSGLFFLIVTNEIGSEIVTHLLNPTNFVRQQLDRVIGRKENEQHKKEVCINSLRKSKLINLYKYFQTYNFVNEANSEKIIGILKKLYGNQIDFLNLSSSKNYRAKGVNIEDQGHLEEKFIRKKRESHDIVDITECPFNLSAQSIEQVVDEIVDEVIDGIPVDEINEEIKTDYLTSHHENQLKRLGKTNINKDVLREMMKLETPEETKFRNATEKSIKKVILKMVNEVINALRKNAWMKDLIIQLFEEGYSVQTVLDTISNQVSVEELMKSMEMDGVNITHYQRKLILDEFKDYKSLLRKMLNQEVQLWEYQLTKNQSLIRHRRDLANALKEDNIYLEKKYMYDKKISLILDELKNFNDRTESNEIYFTKFGSAKSRIKRDINDNEIFKTPGVSTNSDDYDIADEDLDKELADIKKSSMPKRKKIKILQKKLKGLLDQTENENDITFPDNFEEELMRTENLYDEVTPNPQRIKPRIRWNVRTRKPTTKVITYPMKIRLNRGRPFIPLTTTEEQTLIMVVSKPPAKRSRTKKPVAKKIIAPTTALYSSSSNLPEFKDELSIEDTTFPNSFKIQKSTKKSGKSNLKQVKTFSPVKTFKTMKFVQKTQQPVISLQEFLKRRNEFRREKQDDLFNRPSSVTKEKEIPKTRNLSDLSEDEEEFSFEAKLSAEVNPSMFTISPPITTSEAANVVEKPSIENNIASTEPIVPKTHKIRKAKKRKTNISNSNLTQSKNHSQASIATEGDFNTTEDLRNTGNLDNSIDHLRHKRDLSFLQPVTDPIKVDDFNGLTIPPLVISKEKYRSSIKNKSLKTLEDKIHLHNWAYGVRQPKESSKFDSNKTDSFETYQREHRKWFGVRRRGVPVNNFDIDWDQMRRKVEMNQVPSWQKQKSSFRPLVTGKQSRKNERIATPLTQATTPLFLDSSEKPSNLLDNMYKSAMKKTKIKSFDKPYISGEKRDEKVNSVYPPFGKTEKDGHTAFGRLYHGKKHYQLEDSREKSFHEKDLLRLVNKTYDPDFRLSTHRKSNWDNRTFDPNYVFTQFVPMPGKAKGKVKSILEEAENLVENRTENSIVLQNETPVVEDLNIFKNQTTFKNTLQNVSDTFVNTQSKRVAWDNSTDLETYKLYIKSRKRFYNKTIDIAFSYFIFHKFRCGDKTRDLGYGRMSNVVNRWYNKTFIPKYRPDMFYVRNRYKRGKEFNYFKSDANKIHANISAGEFNLTKWMQIATEMNLEESNRTKAPEEESRERKQKKRIIEVFASGFPFKSTPVPEVRYTTHQWKHVFSTLATKALPTKPSFFEAVKKKGFGFFRSLFGAQESEEKD